MGLKSKKGWTLAGLSNIIVNQPIIVINYHFRYNTLFSRTNKPIYLYIFITFYNILLFHDEGGGLKSRSGQSACAALGRCRQNVVATINGDFFSSSSPLLF